MVLLILCACTAIDVKTDHDPTADFTKFKTFAFGGMTDLNRGGVLDNSLTRGRIESAIDEELTKKGLERVEPLQQPDLLVHYWVGVKDKQRIESTGPPAGPYGWRGGYGWGAGYGGVMTYDYKEGTLLVDLVEPAKKELMWRATIVAPLEDTTQGNIELGKKAIAKAFEDYPPKKPR